MKSHNYERYLKRRSKTGNWFMFFEDYLEVMSLPAAIIIQKIINLAKMDSSKEWIRCTSRYLFKKLKLGKETQNRIFKELIEKGFIKVKRHGFPSKRYIRINFVSIEKAIDEVKKPSSGRENTTTEKTREKPQLDGNPSHWENRTTDGRKSQSLGKPDDWIENEEIALKSPVGRFSQSLAKPASIKKKESFKELSPDGDGKNENTKTLFDTKSSCRSYGKELALILIKGLQAARKIMRGDYSISRWTSILEEQIRKVSERDSITIGEAFEYIRTLLLDHIEHIQDDYQPKAYSAKTFCGDKFVSIEEARNRRKKGNSNGNGYRPKTYYEAAGFPTEKEYQDYHSR